MSQSNHDRRFGVGIDLGTSNCAVATADSSGSIDAHEILQVAGAGAIDSRAVFPSALYVLGDHERTDALAPPWKERLGEGALDESGSPRWVLGTLARKQSSLVPDQVATSAKSWLCNGRADRRGPILPWGASDAIAKFSPWEISRRFLEHLRLSLESTSPDFREHGPGCDVVLTVPASFDEVARTLTHEAALAAGFPRVVLLEEPQAAFYAWLAARGDAWRTDVATGDVVLVCDVGGGTVDFTLIAVEERNRQLELTRISVGEHILLGGDNMDLALALRLKSRLEEEGKRIGQWELVSLVHAAREAKELLFSPGSPDSAPISIAGRGASLFKSVISTELIRGELENIVVDGFFPRVGPKEFPIRQRSVGLREIGLDYASDPAVTKHLARFLARSFEAVKADEQLASRLSARLGDGIVRPNAVLFNGGVFKADLLRSRVIDLLTEWCGEPVRELGGADLELAVSRGAAHFAAVTLGGGGIRIRAGTGRSYYLGLESGGMAVPGYRPPVKGVCVVPKGTEEGSELELSGSEFGLVVGEPVEFRFFSSEVLPGTVGEIVEDAERELEETARLEISLPAGAASDGTMVPVTLRAAVTDVGTLDLRMHQTAGPEHWKLEFNVRGEER